MNQEKRGEELEKLLSRMSDEEILHRFINIAEYLIKTNELKKEENQTIRHHMEQIIEDFLIHCYPMK
jgi:hypothetical protein